MYGNKTYDTLDAMRIFIPTIVMTPFHYKSRSEYNKDDYERFFSRAKRGCQPIP